MNRNKKILIIAGVAVVILTIGGAVAVIAISRNSNANVGTNASAGFRAGFGAGANANFANVRGTVNSITDKTLVVDVANNGGQRLVIVSDSTNITKLDPATKADDIVQGQTISVQGTISGTAITATTINYSALPARTGATGPGAGTRTRGSGAGAPGGAGTNIGNRNVVRGSITAINGNTITVQSLNGTNYTVTLDDTNTKYTKTVAGTIADLKESLDVSLIGTADTSGTVTARNITIGAGMLGFGGA